MSDTWLHEVRAVGMGEGGKGRGGEGCVPRAVLTNWKTGCYLQWLRLPGEVRVAGAARTWAWA